MYSAIGVEPTKESASTWGCSISASTATLSPCTTLNTPSGAPASLSSSAILRAGEGSHSERLAHAPIVNAAANLLAILAFQEVRDSTDKLDHLHPADNFALGVGEDFPVFTGNHPRKFVVMLFEQRFEFKEHARTP